MSPRRSLVVCLRSFLRTGIRPILVHGGGPEINQWLTKVGIEPKFLNGLRVTDEATMEIVEMVLVGKVNKSLVSLINSAGGRAVGICGKDGNTLRGRVRDPELGFVGDVTSVDTTVLKMLVNNGQIPVVATVAMTAEGQALNVNADTAVGRASSHRLVSKAPTRPPACASVSSRVRRVSSRVHLRAAR